MTACVAAIIAATRLRKPEAVSPLIAMSKAVAAAPSAASRAPVRVSKPGGPVLGLKCSLSWHGKCDAAVVQLSGLGLIQHLNQQACQFDVGTLGYGFGEVDIAHQFTLSCKPAEVDLGIG